MALSPTITATVQARDEASPVIQKFLKAVHDAAASTGKLGGMAGSAMDMHSKALDSLGSRLRTFYGAANEAAAGFAAVQGLHMLHSVAEVGKVMENEQRKLMSFSNTTVEQMERIRRQIDSTFSTVKGGPEGAMEAVRAGTLSGVQAENVAAALPTIALHATETNESMEHSAEALIGLANMLGSFKDAVGKATTAGASTRDQFTAGLKDAENVAIAANLVAPGSLREQVEAIKVVAPTASSLGVDRADMLALIANMAENGVGGSHGGQYVKSAMSRIAAPTAVTRSAIASLGLHASDYQHVNTSLLDEGGVDAGLSQALGPLNAGMKSAVHRLLEQFKADANQEAFQSGLTDAIRKDGGKKSPVIAANIAERALAPAVTGIDLVKLLDDISAKGGGTGALIGIFGKEVGGALGKLLSPELDRLRGEFRTSLGQDHVSHALEENADSYTTKVDGLKNSLKGLEDQLFIGLKPAIEFGASGLTDIIQKTAGASVPIHEAMDALLVGGTALGALKTGGTLATWAINLGKVAGVVEEAGPVLGTVAALAGIEFLPAVAGLAALTAGIEAFMHRAELWHKFELWKNGDVDAPNTPEDAAALRDKIAADRKAIADRHGELMHDLPPNSAVIAAQDHANQVLRRIIGGVGSDPTVKAAEAHRDAVDIERPEHDPTYFAARDAATQARLDLAKRQNVAAHDGYIKAIDRVLAEMGKGDPNAGDMVLGGFRAQRSDLKARLPAGATSSAEIEALDGQIVKRMAENQARLDAALAAERKIRENALDAMGAPKASQADVDKANAAKDAAFEAAKAKQQKDREDAQAAVDRAKQALVDGARQAPEYRAAQAQADEARDRQRAEIERRSGGDPRTAELKRELDTLEAKLSAYERAAAISHPAFTRMGLTGPNQIPDYAASLSGAPTPPPRTGPAFGLSGPLYSGAAGFPDIRSALAGVTVKADPVQVSGTVAGSAEVATSIAVKVETGPELRGLGSKVDYLAHIALSGKMGDDMTGSMGAHRPAPSGISSI